MKDIHGELSALLAQIDELRQKLLALASILRAISPGPEVRCLPCSLGGQNQGFRDLAALLDHLRQAHGVVVSAPVEADGSGREP